MARVIYGVHGTGRGHAMRALSVAFHYPEHEFLFVSHGEGAHLLKRHFQVLHCDNPITQVAAHRVELVPTIARTAATLWQSNHWSRVVLKMIGQFKPDVAITDYEFFVPRAARAVGLPCLSIGNQHALTKGQLEFPVMHRLSWLGTALPVRLLFSSADQYVISNFFDASAGKQDLAVRWAPSLIRDQVTALRPETRDHVVAYQGYPTTRRFIEVLGALGRPVHFYGQEGDSTGSVCFKGFDGDAFLEDLASCAYVVCGGGHTLISEALYLGKPVLSVPVDGMFEQLINALYLERYEYGSRCRMTRFAPETLREFENRSGGFREQIAKTGFYGNPDVFAAVDDFIAGRWRAGASRQPAAEIARRRTVRLAPR